jgi:hypothetical protein
MTVPCRLALTTLFLVTSIPCRRLQAQESARPLPVQLTVGLGMTYPGTPPGADGWQPSWAWMGRIGVRLADALYVGVGAESWGQDTGSSTQVSEPSSWLISSAQVTSWLGYAQYYPFQAIAFVRGGAGLAFSYTNVPAGPYIASTRKKYFAWTIGAGADIRIHRPIYFTPALDYTSLVDVPEGPALDHGLTLSVGLTIR